MKPEAATALRYCSTASAAASSPPAAYRTSRQ